MKDLKELCEGFYKNAGAKIDPTVKMKWDAIINGKIDNCAIWKGKHGRIFYHDTFFYNLDEMEKKFSEVCMEVIDLKFNVVEGEFVILLKHFKEIEIKPLFRTISGGTPWNDYNLKNFPILMKTLTDIL